MIKTLVKCFVAATLLTLVSCNNEKKEKTTVEEKPASVKEEPKKTEISIGADGAEVKTKSGTEVKVGDKGTSVNSKDVKVEVKKDQ